MLNSLRRLVDVPDADLFETLSEGIRRIVDNAASLDETARRLVGIGDFRGSEVMRGFAEEEAGKALVLIDFVRCPRDSEKRLETLKRFRGHVAKRIHAMACSYPKLWTFKMLELLVEVKCRPWHCDGPNGVDWIFRNSIREEREQLLYVDYVQDVSDGSDGAFCWTDPASLPQIGESREYQVPDCIKLVQALNRAGVVSTAGLAEVADIWRGFKPASDTQRFELWDMIQCTLNRTMPVGDALDETGRNFIVWHWSFPLWSLEIREPQLKEDDLRSLREDRACAIKSMEEAEAKRDPPPEISRAKVEELSAAYAAWRNDVDQLSIRRIGGMKLLTPEDIAKHLALPSYAHVRDLLAGLSERERVALVALGWYGRGPRETPDWTKNYDNARGSSVIHDYRYQIGLGGYWRTGLARWESKPRPFQAGSFR